MENEHPSKSARSARALAERLSGHPELAEKLHALIDELEASLATGAKADAVEDRLHEQVRQVGRQAFTDWAGQAQAQISSQAPAQYPGAVRHAKKNSAGKASSATSKFRSKSGG